MSITTYAELKTAITTWTDRGDLTGSRDADFPTLFEAYANRVLRVRQMLTTTTLTPASGSATIPTDYLEWKRVTWTGSSRRSLEWVEPDYLQAAYPSTPAGTPEVFTIEGSTLRIRPTDTTDLDFTYYQKIPALSDNNTTNWLLTAHPDLYLYGCLVELFTYSYDTDKLPFFMQRRDALVAELNALSRATQAQTSIRPYMTVV